MAGWLVSWRDYASFTRDSEEISLLYLRSENPCVDHFCSNAKSCRSCLCVFAIRWHILFFESMVRNQRWMLLVSKPLFLWLSPVTNWELIVILGLFSLFVYVKTLMCKSTLSTCMSVHHVPASHLWKPEEGNVSSETEVANHVGSVNLTNVRWKTLSRWAIPAALVKT